MSSLGLNFFSYLTKKCGVLALKKAAQAHALIEQRSFVTADDIQAVFVAVAAHRIGLSEAETLYVMQQVKVS